jgi:hypothetical protein
LKVLITTSKHFASFRLATLLKDVEVLFGDDFTDFPTVNSNSLAHQMLTFCLDHQIQKVFPLKYEEVSELRKAFVLFNEFGIEIMLGADDENLNHYNKKANSYAELSAGLIALGYPNQKIAIADANGRGELILIDDTVSNNLQIWNRVTSVNFNQLGKWFNQSDFKPVFLYQLNDDLQTFFVLIDETGLKAVPALPQHICESLNAISQNTNLKGFYHVAVADQNVLRIVNNTL